jgi:hypothetical protein
VSHGHLWILNSPDKIYICFSFLFKFSISLELRFSLSIAQNSFANKNLVLNFVSQTVYRVLVKGRSCLIAFSRLSITPHFTTAPCIYFIVLVLQIIKTTHHYHHYSFIGRVSHQLAPSVRTSGSLLYISVLFH